MQSKVRAMKNVTVTLDEDTLARARVQAAERNMSLSRYIGEVVRARLKQDDRYAAAYRAWRAEKLLDLKGPSRPYPKREELYDRPVLPRR
jgi:hypothetical protein